jgi:hypothetical protein
LTASTTEQRDAWGNLVTALRRVDACKPSGVAQARHDKVEEKVVLAFNDWAAQFSDDFAASVEASNGYTQTGGTGAICS